MSTIETRSPLDLGVGVVPTKAGLRLPDGMDFDEWVEVGQRLGRVASSSTWWLADWLFYGEWEYGTKYEDGVRLTGLEYDTLAHYKQVAGRYGNTRRREDLSFAHHRLLVAMTDAEQEHWLTRASENGWSLHELREQLRGEKVLDSNPNNDGTAITLEQLKLTVPQERAERWKTAAEHAGVSFQEWCADTLDAAAKIEDDRT